MTAAPKRGISIITTAWARSRLFQNRIAREKAAKEAAENAAKSRKVLPDLDGTGKIHGVFDEVYPKPNEFKNYKKDELFDFRDSLEKSLNRRKADNFIDHTPDLTHSQRITQEEELLRSLDKYLSGP